MEYFEDGSPCPDGRLTVEISHALAQVWDPQTQGPPLYKNPQQTYVYPFKDMKFIRETNQCLVIVFPNDRGDRANSRLQIPWSQVLSVQVDGNSAEYVQAAREWHGDQPHDIFDTRFGGTCIACASRG